MNMLHLKTSEDGSLGTTLLREYVVVVDNKTFVVNEAIYVTNPHDEDDFVTDVTVKTAEEAMSDSPLPDHVLEAIKKKIARG